MLLRRQRGPVPAVAGSAAEVLTMRGFFIIICQSKNGGIMKGQKTAIPTPAERAKKTYFLVDASGKTLGRLASSVASILLGKHKACWVPFLDTGDFVIVVNAAKVKMTGKKMTEKVYYRHSGYLGGLKKETFKTLVQKSPETLIMHSVKGMIPHNRLGSQLLKKLKVYRGATHPHRAQKPVTLEL
jgi:large subunit ribosomal protein L13